MTPDPPCIQIAIAVAYELELAEIYAQSQGVMSSLQT